MVNTNAPGSDAQISITIKGEIWQAVQLSPSNASFGRLTMEMADKGAIRKLTVTNNTDEPLKLSEPKSNSPRFKAELTPIEPGKRYELTVTLVPPLVSGNNAGQIEIETGVAEMPKLSVQANAFVTAPVDVSPTTLALTPGRTTELTRQFYVRSNIGKPITITNLQCSAPQLKLNISNVREQMAWRLDVTIPPDYVPKTGVDAITFDTNEPSTPHITIPISEMAQAGRPAPTAARPQPMRPAPVVQGVSPLRQNVQQGAKPPPEGAKPVDANPAEAKPGEAKPADSAAVKPAEPAKAGSDSKDAKPAGN